MMCRRRQKSLQFITTELVLMIMNQEQCYGPATVNPSDISLQLRTCVTCDSSIDITRRRIYDIIHVLSCVGLLRRLSYRLCGWEGMTSMQQLFSQLLNVPVDKL